LGFFVRRVQISKCSGDQLILGLGAVATLQLSCVLPLFPLLQENLDQETIMAKLTSKGRSKLSASQFALPEQKKYPINDKAHARNTKARASEMENEGRISAATKDKIDRASDRVINRGK
jgi:hypothetical protein